MVAEIEFLPLGLDHGSADSPFQTRWRASEKVGQPTTLTLLCGDQTRLESFCLTNVPGEKDYNSSERPQSKEIGISTHNIGVGLRGQRTSKHFIIRWVVSDNTPDALGVHEAS